MVPTSRREEGCGHINWLSPFEKSARLKVVGMWVPEDWDELTCGGIRVTAFGKTCCT